MEADGARENTLVGHGATTGNRRCWNDSRCFAATGNHAAPEACWNRLSPWGTDNKSCNLQLDLLEPAAGDDTSTPFFLLESRLGRFCCWNHVFVLLEPTSFFATIFF